MIGYSFGGGITLPFAAHYPYLVKSIFLLALGRLLRVLPDDYQSVFFRYPSLTPSWYLRRLVGKILGVDLASTVHTRAET